AAPQPYRARWHERVKELSGLKLGIVWAGQTGMDRVDERRSIPLARLMEATALDGVTLVSVQKGPAAQQIARLDAGGRIVDWTPDLGDFADTAALVGELDLVVTVDTSVAHVAGALGKPVWVL